MSAQMRQQQLGRSDVKDISWQKDFVTQRNGQLWLNNEPYRFVGTNFWYAPILASEGQGGDRQRH